MQICHSSEALANPPTLGVATLLDVVAEGELKRVVESISVPRHFAHEEENNRRVGAYIKEWFQECGYKTTYQGDYSNVVALPTLDTNASHVLVGAHYDSVPESPGADDNASAIAAMLICAKTVASLRSADSAPLPICFVAFNREEDGLLGSREFVEMYLRTNGLHIAEGHVLEMVGYCSLEPGSQHLPAGLPIAVRDAGDFLGLIANAGSAALVDDVLVKAKTYLPQFPVTGLKVPAGAEKYLPPLERSDHVPFWDRGIPALMWTDTAEYRNPNYHQQTDTPDTLDYTFLRQVTQLLVAQVLERGVSAEQHHEPGA